MRNKLIPIRSIAWVCAALLGWHAPLQAQVLRMVGPWAIHDENEGCSMRAQTRDGTSLNLSVFKSDPSRAQLRLANSDWRSLTETRTVRVDVLINGQNQSLRPVETFSRDGRSGIVLPFGKDHATKIFREQVTFAVIYRTNTLVILYLNDPTMQAAFQAVQQCAGVRFDPFAAR
jgi:hypothetical protein